jgi:hypothetical protein
VAVAEAILVGVMVLAVLTLATSAMGANEWASAFGYASEMIAPLALVATIILIWTGISAAITAAKKAVAADATAAGATVAVADVTLTQAVQQILSTTLDSVADGLVAGATDLATLQVTPASFKFLSGILKIFNTGQKLRLEQLNDRLVDKKAEYDAMMEEAEQETDVLQGFARISASPATADWSMFAALYDYPYERSGGTLHTGNVLRTTKQAIRKATYEDIVFKDILIMS